MQLGDETSCLRVNGTSQMCKGMAYTRRVGPTIPYAASNSSTPFWYSFKVGLVHFISLSVEQAWQVGTPQYKWAANDIANVNRSLTPWVVVFVHRPVYCSNSYACLNATEQRLAYEPLFQGTALPHPQPGRAPRSTGPAVDVVMTAHVHCYERMWQVGNNGTTVIQNYDGIQTPFYLMQGSAGCIEGSTPWWSNAPAWSAYRACEDVAFGLSLLTFANSTHVRSQFFNAATKAPIDDVWIRKAF